MPTPPLPRTFSAAAAPAACSKSLVYEQQIAQSVQSAEFADPGIDVHDRSHRASRQDAGTDRGRDQHRAREVPDCRTRTPPKSSARETRSRRASSTDCSDSAALAASPIASTPTSITSAIPDTWQRISHAIVRRRLRGEGVRGEVSDHQSRVVVFGVPGEKKLAPEVPKPARADGRKPERRKRQRR